MSSPVPTADPASPARRRKEIRAEIDILIREHFDLLPDMPSDQCPLSVPLYGSEEVSGALEALLEQNVTMGSRVREFKAKFAEFIGSKHAIMVNSGSSANLLALAVLSSPTLPGYLREG
ncbi:MAG TPA: DegT/DnrJ/EryC1/StrS family aminotransferase, partial [Dermatophilaceae bacterium]|nr:DegT/DnrJ/EryC1/StrS family aminotransferase [Dermatophilaceae bacterium]